jgi:CheY-like chemotaxis protein
MILVVDDDPDVNDLATVILTRRGHTVLSAANGTSALALLEQHPGIDLMLTDIRMPEMDGVVLSRHAAKLRPFLPIIFMSGNVAGLIVPQGNSTRFVRKPWRPDALAAEIDGLLSNPKGHC